MTDKANTAKPAEWTVMVYFAADNDLTAAALADLRELKQAGSTDKVNLIAQLDPSGKMETARYYLRKNTYLAEDIVCRRPEINTGDPRELVKFAKWGINKFPAKHYLLVLWGHGQGWQAETDSNPGRAAGRTVKRVPDHKCLREAEQLFGKKHARKALFFLPEDRHFPEAILEEPSRDSLDNRELRAALLEIKEALPGGRKLDVLGLDACLMGTIEVGCQVSESVDYLVASAEAVPLESWPYHSIVAALTEQPELTPEQLALTVVRKYVLDYKERQKYATLTACRLSQAQALLAAVQDLAELLKTELDKGNNELRLYTLLARAQAQSFYLRSYVDLFDFCRFLHGYSDNEAVQKACRKIADVLGGEPGKENSGFVAGHGFYGFPLKDSHGVSVYFPCYEFAPVYAELEFALRTQWHQFLETFILKAKGKRLYTLAEQGIEGTGSFAGKIIEGDPLKIIEGDPLKIIEGDPLKIIEGDPLKIIEGDPLKVPEDPVFRLPGDPTGKFDRRTACE